MNEEAEWIRSALAGDSQAFGKLVTRYQNRLYTAMINVVGNEDEAEDVVQETFIQAYMKLDMFQQNSRFYTWIYRIAFNFALTRRRRNRRQESLDQHHEATGNELADHRDNPEDPLAREESIRLVHQTLQLLKPKHRAILVLREMEGFSYEEIAEILHVSIGTVRSRLNRARLHLKELLDQSPGFWLE